MPEEAGFTLRDAFSLTTIHGHLRPLIGVYMQKKEEEEETTQ